MTATAKIIDLKDKIYISIAHSQNPFGINEYELKEKLQNEIVDDVEVNLNDAIESLISNSLIRAYYPENSYEYYYQVIRK